MNNRFNIVLWFLLFSVSSISQEAKLEVSGAIKIGDLADPIPKPGTIKWSGSDFLAWKGSKWISLTSKVAYDGEVIDASGNRYLTKIIGNQEWMAENLRTSKYRDGTPIPNWPVGFDSGYSGTSRSGRTEQLIRYRVLRYPGL